MSRFIEMLVLAAIVGAPASALAFDPFTSENGDVKDGNELLGQGKPAEALESYDAAARALPNKGAVHLDRGLALARMGDDKIDQAMQAFKLASDSDAPDAVRARAFANLGNAFFKKEDFAAAVEQYKKSLMLAPGNKDVAWNLELSAQKKKKQDEEKKKQEEQQKNQDQQDQNQNQNQDQNQDQDKQQGEKKQDEKQQDEKQQDQKKQQDEKQQDQKQQQEQPEQQQEKQAAPQPKTRQEVEQLLDSLDKQQDNLQKEMARRRGALVPAQPIKDW